ncbi:uncharacterized protein A1O9_01799 [Exophiala aquamarina CBS 119918]|uniref:Tat pathway signal sequence n=1 Tax=Exophiala aquamarina CBS 119918 TaxID=1182545 RepID=A0A072PVE2_9EURO|nr:uncharacterized protein A1O9_01799 [Exophiala aquamarina CBS 119918]KEF63821.1 hypothetical protein A1O9_01799 [Exophiala aquamarina CBS 119918]
MNDRQQKGSEDEDTEALLSDSEKDWERQRVSKPGWLTAVTFIITVSFALIGGIFLGRYMLFDKDSVCTAHVSQNTPLLNQIDLSYNVIRFDGSFLKENIYRQQGRPDVDEAWEALGVNYRSVVIPENQAEQAGFGHDQVKINPIHGGGFPANVEGLHHLHCLNLLRQALWYNFDYYHALGKGAFKNDDRILQLHVSHCLDILRQQLMCKPDLGFLGQVWQNQSFPSAFVDFNTQHKCRNYESLRQWAEARQLPEDVPDDFLQPPEKDDMIYAEIP